MRRGEIKSIDVRGAEGRRSGGAEGKRKGEEWRRGEKERGDEKDIPKKIVV